MDMGDHSSTFRNVWMIALTLPYSTTAFYYFTPPLHNENWTDTMSKVTKLRNYIFSYEYKTLYFFWCCCQTTMNFCKEKFRTKNRFRWFAQNKGFLILLIKCKIWNFLLNTHLEQTVGNRSKIPKSIENRILVDFSRYFWQTSVQGKQKVACLLTFLTKS